jgi:hypothetical protein
MPPEQLVTATGLRFVGKATELLRASIDSSASLEPGSQDNAVYAARFQVRPRMGGASVVPAVLAALHTAVEHDWPDAPPLLRDRPLSRPASRFHGLRWMTDDQGHAWMGELVWRHTHPTVAGAPCTTHVMLEERPGYTSLAVRVAVDDGIATLRGLAGAGQGRPSFLADLTKAARLSFAGRECAPTLLDDDEIESFVRDTLLSETREVPVAVVSPLEAGGYPVPLDELGVELLGLASVYVIERHPTTFRLTDALGDKRLSCYWGALRVYMPGFSCAERPEDHPLLTHERLVDPVLRAGLLGRLGRYAAERVTMPPGVPAVRLPSGLVITVPPATSLETAPSLVSSAPAVAAAASPTAPLAPTPPPALDALPKLLANLDARIGALGATISHLVAANTALADEIARLRTTTALRSSGTASLERRFETLQQTIRDHLVPPPPASQGVQADAEPDANKRDDATDTPSLLDVVREAATSQSDALLILESAERSAAESPYEDADRLAVVLGAMASIARRRQEGAIGTSLRDAFRDLGIDYRGGISPATPDKLRQQYDAVGPDGRTFECLEHVVLGSSYDPRYCLRIYFSSRVRLEPRFVIGHIGRHFDVKSTT